MTNQRVDKARTNPLSSESAVLRSPFSVLRSPFSVLRYVTSKNSSLLTLAILALLICIALTFTACPAEPPASNNTPEVDLTTSTYTMKGGAISDATRFRDVFGGTVPADGNARVLTLTKADLNTGKFHQAESAEGYTPIGDFTGTGLSYSNLESFFEMFLGGIITESQKTQMLNALKSQGVTGVVATSGSTIAVGILRE